MENEILEAIEKDVQEQADLVIEQINTEIDSLRNEEIKSFKEGLAKEQDTYLEKELNDLRVLSITQASRAKLKTKHDLLELRQTLVTEMLEAVKAKLLDFRKTSAYVSYLRKHIETIKENDGYFLVEENDKATLEKVLKDMKRQDEIKIGHFAIGGVKYIAESAHIEYDFSLDTRFLEASEWFMNNSGFTI